MKTIRTQILIAAAVLGAQQGGCGPRGESVIDNAPNSTKMERMKIIPRIASPEVD